MSGLFGNTSLQSVKDFFFNFKQPKMQQHQHHPDVDAFLDHLSSRWRLLGGGLPLALLLPSSAPASLSLATRGGARFCRFLLREGNGGRTDLVVAIKFLVFTRKVDGELEKK